MKRRFGRSHFIERRSDVKTFCGLRLTKRLRKTTLRTATTCRDCERRLR